MGRATAGRDVPEAALAGVVGVVAAAWGAFVTRHGMAISADSATYLGVAENLQLGDGARLAFDEPGHWLDVFPPGLPLVLSAARAFDLDLTSWGRLVTVALLVTSALLVASITRRLAPQHPGAAVVAGILFVLARGTVENHATLLSEPLYVACELAAVRALLARTTNRHPGLLLVVGAMAAGLGLLARYAGLATIAAGALWLLLAEHGRTLRRLTTAGAFTVVALVPFGVWSVISAAVDESVNRRGAAVHGGSARHLRIAVAAFAEWLLPARAGPIVTAVCALAVAAVIGLVGWRSIASVMRPGPPAPLVLPVLVGAANVALVVVTVFFVAEGNFLDRRSLLPAYAALLPVGAAAVADVASNVRVPRALVRGGTVALLVAAAVLQVPHVASQGVEDLGWASASWRDDPAVEVVRSLPPGSVVYSNVPSLLWFTTGVEARRFPGTDVRGGDDGTASAEELDELVRSLRRCGGAAVAFDRDVVGASFDAGNNAAIFAAVGGPTDDYDNATLAVVRDDTPAPCTVVAGTQ